jgi:hypothetical protein
MLRRRIIETHVYTRRGGWFVAQPQQYVFYTKS